MISALVTRGEVEERREGGEVMEGENYYFGGRWGCYSVSCESQCNLFFTETATIREVEQRKAEGAERG